MKTLANYIDQYGLSGWKAGSGAKAPLVMMLRDEIANAGSTSLASLDRASLQIAFKILENSSSDERSLANGNLPFVSLRLDASKVPQLPPTDDDALFQKQMDAAFKQYASVVFVHGEKDNPFTQHTDYISPSGVVTKDVYVGTDLIALQTYYNGAVSTVNGGDNIFDGQNPVITSKEILQNMLELVLQNGIDTPEHVKQIFGNYIYAPGAAAGAIAQETKLAPLAALSDPVAETVIKGYIAYFGRPADPGGLKFWVEAVHRSGGDPVDLINNFGNSQEYRDMYGNAPSTEVVNSLYQHLFNRDADAGGLKFYADHLDAGRLTLSSIAFDILKGAQLSDTTIVNEKVKASHHFTASLDTQRELDLFNKAAPDNSAMWLSLFSDNLADNKKLMDATVDVINNIQGDVEPILIGKGFDIPSYF